MGGGKLVGIIFFAGRRLAAVVVAVNRGNTSEALRLVRASGAGGAYRYDQPGHQRNPRVHNSPRLKARAGIGALRRSPPPAMA
jgi:hypothetical protein